MIEVKKIKIKV